MTLDIHITHYAMNGTFLSAMEISTEELLAQGITAVTLGKNCI